MIPLSGDEIDGYTPPSLKDVSPRVVFRLRPATPRDKRAFNKLAMVEGLRAHDLDSLRRVQLSELKNLWSDEQYLINAPRLEAAWAAQDQGVDVDADEIAAMSDLLDKLQRASRPLRQMIADNDAFEDDAPKIMLAILLDGWSGIDAVFRREEGAVTLDALDVAQEALILLEKLNVGKVAGVLPGLGWAQLANHVLGAMGFTKADEGKSQSPSSSPSDQNGLTATCPPAANTKQSGASSTKKTPRGSSRKTNGI